MEFSDVSDNITRETMDVDVLIVGGGVAGLSAAYRLKSQVDMYNDKIKKGLAVGSLISEPNIAVIEKASEIGAHTLSGAILNPSALKELIPDFKEMNCPVNTPVITDSVYYLTEDSHFKSPFVPPPFKNEGHYVISLSQFNKWLAQKCEEIGINIFSGFAGVEAIYEGNKIVGVRTGDKGIDKLGKPKSNFEPGLILKSKITIFAEGSRGSLFKNVARKLNLFSGKSPEVFEEGVKEVIQLPKGTVTPGQVIHTVGFPLKKTIGGTFIYTLPDDKIVIGLVGYLDTEDPLFDPHRELQKLKTHPFVYNLIKGGKVISYGGKTLPAGGWYSMPKLYGDGFVVCGDSASMVDVQKLKGIHLAMKSGICAGDVVLKCLKENDYSSKTLIEYEKSVKTCYIGSELYRVRNFHQSLSKGFMLGLPMIALQELSGGRGIVDNMPMELDAKTTEPVVDVWGADGVGLSENQLPKPDGRLFFDKLSSVYLTGTSHDEDSPNHLILVDGDICRNTCYPKYKSPCNHFCPASVYEMVLSNKSTGGKDLQINYTNCIHCKTCDIKCPFENIKWTPPEGGGGPKYQDT